MTYTARYRRLAAQRAYSRADLRTKLAPYRGYTVRPVPVIPSQRRRTLAREVVNA